MSLIALSLRNRRFVLFIAALLLVFGGWTAARMPVDVFPDLNRPTVTVLTEAGGLSPEEVEQLVTRPLETALNATPGTQRVRSQSAAGLSVVWVEFDWSVDATRARQQVAERLSQAEMPAGVVPRMGPASSIMGEILLVGLVSRDGAVSGPALRVLADNAVRPRLLAVSGVAQVIPMGGGVEQLQVNVHPDRLANLGLTLDAVREAAAGAQASTAGGFMERKGQEYVRRSSGDRGHRGRDPLWRGDRALRRRRRGARHRADARRRGRERASGSDPVGAKAAWGQHRHADPHPRSCAWGAARRLARRGGDGAAFSPIGLHRGFDW